MKSVLIRLTDRTNSSECEVFVDKKLVGTGYFGGEAEDNKRYRTYRWVQDTLARLATALGASVRVEESEDYD